MRLTAANVRTLPVPQDRDARIFYDDAVKGFGVRVTEKGARSYVYSYRHRPTGQSRRYTIGSVEGGAWTLDLARDEAKRLRRAVEQDRDPMQERRALHEAPDFDKLADRYLAEWAIHKKTGDADKAALVYWVRPELGKLKVADISHDDIVKLFERISKTSPFSANRIHSLVRKIFNLALVWEWRSREAGNPAQGVRRNAEHQRRRYLDAEELQKLLAMLERRKGQQTADAIWLLLHTGARRGETLAAKWEDIDFRAGRWSKPAHTTKTKAEHSIPLSAEVLVYLNEMRERQKAAAKKAGTEPTPFLFPARTGEHSTQRELKKYWRSMVREAGITKHLRLHDLRHSYASLLISRGVPLTVIGPLLGHTQVSTTLRYSHLADDVLREATQKAATAIKEARNPKPKAEVRALRKRKGGRDAA